MKRVFAMLLTLMMALSFTACGCSHEWQEATCKSPKTCTLCGETEGEVAAHEWTTATCEAPETCVICGETQGEMLAHEWVAATCTEPKTCFTCKTTEGEPFGHKWSEATCTEPKTCSICGLEDGEALGHTLTETSRTKEPTCTETGILEGICTTCEKTLSEEIPLLEHTPGEWSVSVAATYDEAGKKAIACTVCSTVLEEEAYELTEEEKEEWYKDACEQIPYNDFARSPENYEGSRIKIKGEVGIIIGEPVDGEDYSVYYVHTKGEYGFYYEDPIYAFVDNVSARILEGDVVTFYGEIEGLEDAGIGNYPKVNVVYYDIK